MPRDAPTDPSIEELRLAVDELRASRARVASAADEERRRIERALHDGAQQHLVALAVNVQLARQLLESDPDAARAVLDEVARDVHGALDAVRELAYGIYPPLLLDRGVAEALRAAVSTASVPVRVEAEGMGRFSAEIESTLYFTCLEAVRDAAPRGHRVTVRLWQDEADVRWSVTDDAPCAGKRQSVGLTAIRDRIEAIGGSLTVEAKPGAGTRVGGSIPVER
jgi:signal transduction histidine kinase